MTPKVASVAPGLVAPSATWVITANSATLTGFTYVGNVNMPVAGGGTVTMMEFTIGSMAMSGVTTVVTEAGVTGKETDSTFDASDGVTLYATMLSGTLSGTTVTFTPSTAASLYAANLATWALPVTMTDVTADQAMITAGLAQKTAVTVAG